MKKNFHFWLMHFGNKESRSAGEFQTLRFQTLILTPELNLQVRLQLTVVTDPQGISLFRVSPE